jgi:hypothetical protein
MKRSAILITIIAIVIIAIASFFILNTTEDSEDTPQDTDSSSAPTTTPDETPDTTPPETPDTTPANNDATIELCTSLCRTDADAYCQEERTAILNGQEVTGTCRAFSKKGAVPGFAKCEGFCKEYPKSTSQIS